MHPVRQNLDYNIVEQEEKTFFTENIILHKILLNGELQAQHLEYNLVFT